MNEQSADCQLTQVHFETTNHCDYSCFFCPRNRLTRERGVLSCTDLELAMDRVEEAVGVFTGEVHLANFGEPLLDDGLVEKVRTINGRWPDARPLFVSTLGVSRPRQWFADLCHAGLHEIRVSFYAHTRETYTRVTGSDTIDVAKRNLVWLSEIRQNMQQPTLVRVKPTLGGVPVEAAAKDRFADWVQELGLEFCPQCALHNYGRSRVFAEPDDAVCSFVNGYRSKFLQVLWNLDVVPCCFDFDGTIVLGNLRNESVADILAGDRYQALIRALESKIYTELTVCASCSKKREW